MDSFAKCRIRDVILLQYLIDLHLPFLIDLPSGSSESVILIALRKAASGMESSYHKLSVRTYEFFRLLNKVECAENCRC